MNKNTANAKWKKIAAGAPDGVPTRTMIHAFAQEIDQEATARAYQQIAEQRARALREVGESREHQPERLSLRSWGGVPMAWYSPEAVRSLILGVYDLPKETT